MSTDPDLGAVLDELGDDLVLDVHSHALPPELLALAATTLHVDGAEPVPVTPVYYRGIEGYRIEGLSTAGHHLDLVSRSGHWQLTETERVGPEGAEYGWSRAWWYPGMSVPGLTRVVAAATAWRRAHPDGSGRPLGGWVRELPSGYQYPEGFTLAHAEYHGDPIFGARWDAPAAEHAPIAELSWDAPPCYGCGEHIGQTDRGFLRTVVRTDDCGELGAARAPVHLECELLDTLGHIYGVCRHTGYDTSTRAAALVLLDKLNAGRAVDGHGPL